VQGVVTTTVSVGATGVTSISADSGTTAIAVSKSGARGDAATHPGPGIIAGGVIGGVFVLALILLTMWMISHQRRKRRAQRLAEGQEKEKNGEFYTPLGGRHELDPDQRGLPNEAPMSQRHELEAGPEEVEGDVIPVHELDGVSRPGELS